MSSHYQRSMKHSTDLTNEWVHQIDQMVSWEDSNRSFKLLRTTLQALRDMLGVDEAVHLSAELPVYVRGIYFEGWDPSRNPSPNRERADFVARVCEAFQRERLEDPEEAVGIIFSFLNTRISPGEINDVRSSLRKSLREIWPEPPRF